MVPKRRGAVGRKGGCVKGGGRQQSTRSVHGFACAVVIEELGQRQRSAIEEALCEHMFGLVFFGDGVLGEVDAEGAFEGAGGVTAVAAVEDLDFAGDFSLLQIFAVGDIDAVFVDLDVHHEVGVEAACEFGEVAPFAVVIKPCGDVI